jgi:hypothetical protein
MIDSEASGKKVSVAIVNLMQAADEMARALHERDDLIATLRADNIKLAEQCNALREGKPFADGASKNQ